MDRKKALAELTTIVGFKIPVDGLMTAVTGVTVVDILSFDKLLSRHIPKYDHTECTYNGLENVSMSEVVQAEYGGRADALVSLLVDVPSEDESLPQGT